MVAINEIAVKYATVFDKAEAIAEAKASEDMLARLTTYRGNAISFVMDNHTTDGAAFELANARIELIDYTIDAYNEWVVAGNGDAAAEQYLLIAARWDVNMTDASKLAQEKIWVDKVYRPTV